MIRRLYWNPFIAKEVPKLCKSFTLHESLSYRGRSLELLIWQLINNISPFKFGAT